MCNHSEINYLPIPPNLWEDLPFMTESKQCVTPSWRWQLGGTLLIKATIGLSFSVWAIYQVYMTAAAANVRWVRIIYGVAWALKNARGTINILLSGGGIWPLSLESVSSQITPSTTKNLGLLCHVLNKKHTDYWAYIYPTAAALITPW